MSRITWLILLLAAVFSCSPETDEKNNTPNEIVDSKVKIEFILELNPDIYRQTLFGEPPQFAVWLENPENGEIKSVRVTHRAAENNWIGKIECGVALPIWNSKNIYEKSIGRYSVDAVSMATPKVKMSNFSVQVDSATVWKYFIEVNVSGDYNNAFPKYLEGGIPDSEVNGQPSLIYSGEITAIPGVKSVPKIIGRSEQIIPTSEINPDTSGITSAKMLISKALVLVK